MPRGRSANATIKTSKIPPVTRPDRASNSGELTAVFGVGVKLGVTEGVAVGVEVAVGVCVGSGVGVNVAVGVSVGVLVGVAVAVAACPPGRVTG